MAGVVVVGLALFGLLGLSVTVRRLAHANVAVAVGVTFVGLVVVGGIVSRFARLGEDVLVPLGVAFFGLSGLMGLLWLLQIRHLERQGFRRSGRPPSLNPGHRFDATRSASSRGGSRVGWSNITAPLVELRFDERWAHLTGVGLFVIGVAPVWIDRSVVVRVHPISGWVTWGIRFETGDGRYDSMIFWTARSRAVLGALHTFGWPCAPMSGGG